MSVIILGAEHPSTWIVANTLHPEVGLQAIVVERMPSRVSVAKRRARRLGWRRVGGQILFHLLTPLLERESAGRATQIFREANFSTAVPRGPETYRVPSVNDDETVALLQRLAPRVVVVNGTRILSPRVLHCVAACFINTHAGITPKYRGVHGGYWALANEDRNNVGVTVHLVDSGIDSGSILYQAAVIPTERDNFVTYPFLQLAAGLPLLKRAVSDALTGALHPFSNSLPSKLYSHPTLWEYATNRMRRGIK